MICHFRDICGCNFSVTYSVGGLKYTYIRVPKWKYNETWRKHIESTERALSKSKHLHKFWIFCKNLNSKGEKGKYQVDASQLLRPFDMKKSFECGMRVLVGDVRYIDAQYIKESFQNYTLPLNNKETGVCLHIHWINLRISNPMIAESILPRLATLTIAWPPLWALFNLRWTKWSIRCEKYK